MTKHGKNSERLEKVYFLCIKSPEPTPMSHLSGELPIISIVPAQFRLLVEI